MNLRACSEIMKSKQSGSIGAARLKSMMMTLKAQILLGMRGAVCVLGLMIHSIETSAEERRAHFRSRNS